MSSWEEYFQKTKEKKPSPFLVQAIELLGDVRGKKALDLGCGAGRDSRLMSEEGFEVVAVDGDGAARQYIDGLANVHFIQSEFQDLVLAQYDVVNASYSLPFIKASNFNQVWEMLVDSIRPGGVFVGEFFGANDSWNRQDVSMTFHAKEQIETLLAGFSIHELIEEQNEAKTASGEVKFWHVFHVIAQNVA